MRFRFAGCNGHLIPIPSHQINVSSPKYPVSPAASSSSQNNFIATKCAPPGPPGVRHRPTSIQAVSTQHDSRGFSSEGLSRTIMLCNIPPSPLAASSSSQDNSSTQAASTQPPVLLEGTLIGDSRLMMGCLGQSCYATFLRLLLLFSEQFNSHKICPFRSSSTWTSHWWGSSL